ncbi:MAG: phytochrome sensor protein [Phycisphaerales bacterium]|nr:phytochrome sensor protein [Phycisphaerales bacterium]
MARSAERSKSSRFIVLASVCLIVAALYFSREVLIPLALAVLLSFLLSPVVGWLEWIRVPRGVATIVVVTVAVALLVSIGFVVERQTVSVITDLPNYRGELTTKLRSLRGHGWIFGKAEQELNEISSSASAPPSGQPAVQSGHAANSNPPAATQPSADNPLPVRVIPPPPSPLALLNQYASKFMSPLATAGLVLIFVIFMLLTREDLRDRMIRLCGSGQINLTTQAFDEAGTRITRYLGALAIVNIAYGCLVAVGLWLIGKMLGGEHGFPNVMVWGLLVGLLRFVPYVGVWIGAAFPIILSFALFKGNGVFLATIGLFVALEIIVSQFVEPYWYGSSTGMSALAVLVAAVFWTWLWGPIGLLLSTPLTVILVVMGKYIPQLKFLDILLRDEPSLAPPVRFYQRLVAMDEEEAGEIAVAYLEEKKSLEAAYDELLVPALALAEHDYHHGELDEEHHEFVRRAMRDVVEELADQYRAESAKAQEEATAKAPSAAAAAVASAASTLAAAVHVVKRPATNGAAPESPPPHRFMNVPDGCEITVLCLPARDEADELVALMLAKLLELHNYCTEVPTADSLASEMVEMVRAKNASIVCVSALPPAAATHARYLCKRLHGRFPDIKMVVGLWTVRGDMERIKARLSCDPEVRLATTLHEAHEQIEQLAHHSIAAASKDAPEPHPSAEPAAAT